MRACPAASAQCRPRLRRRGPAEPPPACDGDCPRCRCPRRGPCGRRRDPGFPHRPGLRRDALCPDPGRYDPARPARLRPGAHRAPVRSRLPDTGRAGFAAVPIVPRSVLAVQRHIGRHPDTGRDLHAAPRPARTGAPARVQPRQAGVWRVKAAISARLAGSRSGGQSAAMPPRPEATTPSRATARAAMRTAQARFVAPS